jgi:hypothetical protein
MRETAFHEELASGAVVIQTLNRATIQSHFLIYKLYNFKLKRCDV